MMSEGGAELEQLRIPFETIKFGKEIEFQGYGSVYQGEVHGRQVALKRINITNLGDIKTKLLAEILTISRFRHHPNLVALLGFCDEKSNEIILVYEYVGNGCLADKMRKHLTTIQRLEICLGAARGLDYLHTGVGLVTPGIIHGDVKPTKILLNLNADSASTSPKFEAKVSNFGLSKVRPGHVRENVGPTPEYRDPQYDVTGNLSKESDVYSLGVILLEVLCGVPELVDTDDYQERHVTELVPKRLEQNKLRKVVHFDIRNEIKTECLETYAKIACQCVMKSPENRPTMAQVVEQLEEALRLQGGNVMHVHLRSNVVEEKLIEGDPEEDGNGVVTDTITPEQEPEANVVCVERNDDDLNSNDKLDFNEQKKDDEDKESCNADRIDSSDHLIKKNKSDDEITKNEQGSPVSEDGESVLDRTLVEVAQKDKEDAVVMNGNDHDSVVSLEKLVKDAHNDPEGVAIINGDDDVSNVTHVEDAQKENEDAVVIGGNDHEIGVSIETLVENAQNDLESIEIINGDSVSSGTQVEDAKNENEDAVVMNGNDHASGVSSRTLVEGAQNDPESVEISNDDVAPNGSHVEDARNENKNKNAVGISRVEPEIGAAQNSEKKPETIITVREVSFEHSVSNDKLKPIEETQYIDVEKKPETVIVSRDGNFDGSKSNDKLKPIEITKEIKIKRSHSTSSESSHGDSAMPSDSLLQHKSPACDTTMKKPTKGSTNCCSVCVPWTRFFSESVKLLQNCFVRRAILE